MKKQIVLLLALAAVFLYSDPAFAQCSMCRAVVESDGSNSGQGLNNGILYLMGFPYLIIMLLGVVLFKKVYSDNSFFSKAK